MEYILDNPVSGIISTVNYRCDIIWRNGQFIADEPVKGGGNDEGPDPFTLLVSSLVSCILITLRMYIDRKGWDIKEIHISSNLYKTEVDGETITVFEKYIRLPSSVTADQKERILKIADACPVSKILLGKIQIKTGTENN
jgi:putative redox protein